MLAPTYPIETPRLLLRPFVPADFDELFAIRSRPDVTRFLYWEPSSREEAAAELAKRVRERTLDREGETLHLAMELRDGGAMIGDVGLTWLSERHQQGEIGFVVHPDFHGRGLAREGATGSSGSASSTSACTASSAGATRERGVRRADAPPWDATGGALRAERDLQGRLGRRAGLRDARVRVGGLGRQPRPGLPLDGLHAVGERGDDRPCAPGFDEFTAASTLGPIDPLPSSPASTRRRASATVSSGSRRWSAVP